MKAILFGATGMVGQGVLRECLLDPEVENVVAVGRSATGQQHEKLYEIVLNDLFDLSSADGKLSGYDACFFCLGVSSVGMKEEAYRRVTYDLTMAVAETLLKLDPSMTFVYVSGANTDSTERGRVMWARVKGKTENALLQMPFKAAYMFRPGYIQPLRGVRTKTKWYGAAYAVMAPLYPVWKILFPKYVTTTECLGRAMLNVAKRGAPKSVLENQDINGICQNGAQTPRWGVLLSCCRLPSREYDVSNGILLRAAADMVRRPFVTALLVFPRGRPRRLMLIPAVSSSALMAASSLSRSCLSCCTIKSSFIPRF